MKAKVINVIIREDESGMFFASSSDLRGLHLACETLDELREEIPLIIKLLLEAEGLKVSVIEAEAKDLEKLGVRPWIAVPAAQLSAAH